MYYTSENVFCIPQRFILRYKVLYSIDKTLWSVVCYVNYALYQ